MARAMVRRALVRSPKRGMFWEGAALAFTNATGTASVLTVVSETTLETIPNPTLIRVRGQGIVYATAIGASGAQAMIGIGLIKVTAKALAAGVASLPTPGTDSGSDWLWHSDYPIGVRGSLGADSESDGSHVTRFDIDNKAMRKFEPNEVLVMVVENVALTSTVTVQVTVGFRILFKK